MKLRTKLTLTATVIVILAVFISTFLVITFTKQNSLEEITSAGTADFEDFYNSFRSLSTYANLNTKETSLYSYLRYKFYNITGCHEFVLQKGDNIVSNNTGVDAVKVLDAYKSSTKVFSYNNTMRHTICNILGQTYFVASADVLMEEQVYTLSIVRNVTDKMDDINRLGIKCAIVGAAVIVAAALLVFLFVRRSLMPVRRLEEGAIEISDGRYENRIHIKGHDEIASLAERFNRMAEAVSEKIDALGETSERQQAFINALSHEMKTPVTSIMARAETLLVRDIGKEDQKRSLERIYNQCAWLERLSGKLTTLVMLQGSVDVKPQSVGELFAAVEEAMQDVLDEKNITLVTECKIDTLLLDFDLMLAELVNLVDNARKASDNGCVITLRAYNQSGSSVIEVEDGGRGIPKEEIERITQPFYMVDRSRSKKNGGSGLGLALAERIAKAHGARLTITSTLGKGTTVKIIFTNGMY